MDKILKLIDDMAYNISASVEEVMFCIDDIKEYLEQEREIRTSTLSVMMDDLKSAYEMSEQLQKFTAKIGNTLIEISEECINENNNR